MTHFQMVKIQTSLILAVEEIRIAAENLDSKRRGICNTIISNLSQMIIDMQKERRKAVPNSSESEDSTILP